MRLPLYHVDAFTDRVFAGNPAAVVPLEAWLPDATLQAIATENNLSETAFFVREQQDYALRWFTPTTEVELCGHATLASAHVIFERLEPGREHVAFRTLKAGTLTVTRQGPDLAMDFPADPPRPVAAPAGFAAALGAPPLAVLAGRYHLAVYERAADVAALRPDFTALARVDCVAAIPTAPGENGIDFVSRCFTPAQGIPEDPVTGSSHCALIPYWAERLGKTRLRARQISARGGDINSTFGGGRVTIAGQCVAYLEGTISF